MRRRENAPRYADRWPTEVAFEESRRWLGPQPHPKAVERTAPFQLASLTLTIVWYAASGHHPDVIAEHRARVPW